MILLFINKKTNKYSLNRRKFITQSTLIFTALALPFPILSLTKLNNMKNLNNFDIIIIGGSYAGLSAAMALGRFLRTVLVIDSGKPCNSRTPHSHNFLTQDGKTPNEILTIAKEQVSKYKTIQFYDGFAVSGIKTKTGFEITTQSGSKFTAKKLIFATGVKNIMPKISGFYDCWGISVIHCPYCHGYEYSNTKTGILANSDMAFEMGKLINNWTSDLTVFTNGAETLTIEQVTKLKEHNIKIIDTQIASFEHNKGQIKNIIFNDGSKYALDVVYARPEFEQQCDIPKQLNCEFTDQNYIKIDEFQSTTISGIFACGDNTSRMRAVSYAVAMGGIAGVMSNKELIDDEFK